MIDSRRNPRPSGPARKKPASSGPRWAIERARGGFGPTLIECETYRMAVHTTADDPKRYRTEAEVEAWRLKDPVTRFQKYLEARGLLTAADVKAEAAAVLASRGISMAAFVRELLARVAAGDGRQALDAHARHAPDLVVLDVMLPGMNGFETCRELRKRYGVELDPQRELLALIGSKEGIGHLPLAVRIRP